MSHPDEGVLHALLDRELDAGEATRLETHLAACAECRARLAEARAFRDEAFELVETLDAAPAMVFDAPYAGFEAAESDLGAPAPNTTTPTAGPRARAPRRWIPGLAWAATVILAVTAGYLVGLDRTGGRTEGARPQDLALGTGPEGRPAAPPRPPDRRTPSPVESKPERPRTQAAEPAPARAPAGAPAADSVVVGRVLANATPRDTVQVVVPAASDERAAASAAAKLLPDAAPQVRTRAEIAPAAGRARGLAAEQPADDSMIAAIRVLGGSLRLVEGLVPARIEIADSLVRVHYVTAAGGFVLEEWREGERIQTRVRSQPGTPRDSILAWSRRIR